MRLDRQVHPAGLEDRQHRRHPVQVALGHHRHHALAAQPPRQQRPAQLVRPGVELGVGPLPVAADGRDGVRVRPHPLLEQLVHPAVRQLPARSGQPVELEAELGRGTAGIAGGARPAGRRRSARARPGDSRRSWPRASASSTSVRYRSRSASRPRCGQIPTHSTVSGASAPSPPTGSNTVSKAGPATPSSPSRSPTPKSWWDSSSRSARWVSSSSARHEPEPVASRHGSGSPPGAREVARHHLATRRTARRVPWRARPAAPSSAARPARPPAPATPPPGQRGTLPRAWQCRAPDPGSIAGSR